MKESGMTYYKKLLGYYEMPAFLIKYLDTPCLTRLQNVGYFCGMDYASKDIYDFSEYISSKFTIEEMVKKCIIALKKEEQENKLKKIVMDF